MADGTAFPWSFFAPASLWGVIRSSKLAKDAGKLMGLQFAGRVVAFFASAYAMRCLGPEQLGIGAFVLSIIAQAAVLGDLGMSIAGVRAIGNQPDRVNEFVSLVWGVRLRAAILLSFIVLAGILIFHPVGSFSLWLLALPVLIFSVLNPQWIFQGLERVPAFNLIQFGQALATALLYVLLFRPGAPARMYILVALIAQGASWIASYLWLWRIIKVSWLGFSWTKIWGMIRSSGFAFAIVLTIFVYTGLDIPLVTLLRSSSEAGIYRSAQGVLSALTPFLAILPLLIYPRLLAWKNHSRALFIRNVLGLVVGVAVLAAIIGVSSLIWVPLAFRLLLGQAFSTGIKPCILLVMAKCIVMVGTVPAWGLHSLDLDRRYLWVTLCAAITSITFNLTMIPRVGITAAAMANILSESVITLGAGLAVITYLRVHREETFAVRPVL
jgi:PST family polysaccharide transporter